ncbi:ABC-three component system middle component 1 [Crocinitomix catalasitica]|uniref:ABC-three component system middle component 1 n=1 Tax=Crocinitomix catalasitica TaxID=184607 RepID=UPI0004827928|nr:ABC-three component system middle component 1 [Crocinitomix catalasitica]
MPLNKAKHIIQSLKKKDETISFENLTCWEYKEDNYSLYMFSIQLKNQDELLKIHEELRDYIAIYFQSQILEKDIERWNIYQFFFIQEKVEDNTKQKIEQDKFSTRKIILDNLKKSLLDEQIKSLINLELFEFKIETRKIDTDTVDEKLNKEHSSLLALIDKIGNSNLDDSLELILNSLGNE